MRKLPFRSAGQTAANRRLINDSRRPERLRRRRRQLLLESLETRQLLATLTVSTGFDITDANDGLISLREAIATAESNGEADTIVFAPSLAGTEIQLIEIGDSTATEGRSLLKISSDINIVGPATIVRGQSASNARLFLVDGSGRLTLDTVTLSNGLAQGGNGGDSAAGGGGGGAGLGGAIWNRGTVTIQSSTLSGNTAQGGNGGRSGVNGLARGGASGGSLLTNGANPINDNGVAGVNGGGSGGGLAQGALIQVGGDGGGAGFGSGGGGGGFGVSSGGNGSFHGGGIGGAGGFGGGGGGEGRGTGGQNYASRPNSAAGFGGGFGSNNGGGGGAGLGGAIFNDGGTLTITNSTLSSNAAVGGNGGAGSGGIFSGQGGYGHGGAVFNRDGSVTITSSTLANNNVNNGGGSDSSASGTAIYNLQSSGTATINVTNSILASTDIRNDAFNDGGTVLGSNNLIEQNGNFPSEVIVSSAAPMLGPLQFNGGPTRTHALLTGSPAIDAGIALAPASINLARQAGAVASQSSTNFGFTADRAINGIANDFSHTASTDTSPSWQVTFPSDSVIENVTLRNRTDGCCQGRLRDITVEILDRDGAVVFTSDVLNPRSTAGNDVNVGPAELVVDNIPANTMGRTVRVRREPQDGFGGGDFDARVLTLSEVVVQGVVSVVNDQRGIPFARVSGTGIDLGAVESFIQPPLVVSTLADELDNDFSDGDFSLREAIALANATSAADTITFAPSLDGTIELTLGQLLVTAPLTISSSSDNRITIDALDNSRVIDISETAGDVSLVALVIQNGETNAENQGGAGIRSRSTGLLTLNDTIVRSNDALGATSSGGGISSTGEVVIRNSTISGNSAQGTNSRGGGVYSYDGKITLIDSTVSANYTISGYGGGVGTIRSTITAINSTISGNLSVGGSNGAGIGSFSGPIILTNSTVTLNSSQGANGTGGGVGSNQGSITVNNSIIAGNTAANGPDLNQGIGSPTLRSSLLGDNSGTSLVAAPVGTPDSNGNLIGTGAAKIDPLLGPLADNGGSTQTHALLTDSPALNAGSNDLAVDAASATLTSDQRGTGFARIADTTVDIGAFERVTPAGFTVVQSDGSTQVSETGTTDTFTVVLTNAPTSNVVLTVVSADTGEATVSAATLTFTPENFATPQTITVTGVNDTIRDGSQSTNITLAVDDANSADAYDSLDDQVVAVTTTDNETSSLLVVQSGGNTSVFDSGTTDTLTVALSSAPVTNVVVNVSLSSTTHASLNTAALTFTPANFATPQTVTVTGKNDNVANGDQTATIAIAVNNATSDDLWDDVTAPNVNVSIVEGRFDFGDAPATFPTLLPGGARHQAVGPTLGTRRDIEDDGQPNATATGDDTPAGFANAVKVASGSGGNVSSNAVGDLNGDGNLDLVMAVIGNATANPVIPDTLAVLLGNGDGTFAAPTQVALGAGTGAIFVVLDDFDGDQVLDAAVLNSGTNDVSLLIGKGDGTFETASVISLGSTPATVATGVNQIASANVGGSAAPDLVIVGSISDDITVLINNGNGTFAAPQSFATFTTPPGIGGGGFSLIVEDLNDDGNRDVAVANFASNDITVMLNSGTGTFPNVKANLIDPAGTNGAAGPGTVVAGDFNGDDNVDLLTANANSGNLTLLTGNGTDTFAAQAPIALPNSGPGISFLTTILARDLNGDGNLDVVITDQGTGNGGAVYVMLGNGHGTFQTATRLTGGLTAADSAFRLSIADLNKDGTAELIADVGTGVAIFSTTQGDEDGVTFPAAPIGTTAQGSVTINLQNAAPTTNLLDAWIDFNRDGDWDDAGEKIFNGFSLGTTNGPQTLNFPLPQGIVAGNSFARFRLSTTGISTPGGLANDGEVEDHRVALVTPVITPTLDFGDAPATYPVTLAQDGARHTVGALFFGAKVDAEANGISSASADSDGDDEDGVFVLTTFITSTVATTSSFSVFASQAGKLDGWIDFNNDGDWSDAGEQIFTSADVVAGENLLSFTIPAGATSGSPGARFRLSTAGGLAPTGLAADGEVEDYLANVVTGSANALLNIAIPVGDVNGAKSANISVEGTDLVVKKNDVVLFKAPFASFGNLSLNGSSIDDILQLTILEALATRTLEFDGGLGKDFLELVAAGQTLDLTNARITLSDVEGVDVTGTGANRLVISIDAVKNASSTTDTLEVVADADDTITFVNGFKVETPTFINGEFTHIITETVEGGTARVELRNGRPLTNPLTPFDADRNGRIQPLDALRIINELSRRGAGPITLPTNDGEISRLYVDVSGDSQLTALDALRVINAIARISSGASGEGEAASVLAAPDQSESNESIDSKAVSDNTSVSTELTPSRSQQSSQQTFVPALSSHAVDEFFVGYDDEEPSVEQSQLQLLSSK